MRLRIALVFFAASACLDFGAAREKCRADGRCAPEGGATGGSDGSGGGGADTGGGGGSIGGGGGGNMSSGGGGGGSVATGGGGGGEASGGGGGGGTGGGGGGGTGGGGGGADPGDPAERTSFEISSGASRVQGLRYTFEVIVGAPHSAPRLTGPTYRLDVSSPVSR